MVLAGLELYVDHTYSNKAVFHRISSVGFVVSEAPASAGKVARSGTEDLRLNCGLGHCL